MPGWTPGQKTSLMYSSKREIERKTAMENQGYKLALQLIRDYVISTPESHLPSLSEMARRFGLHRHTIRKAVKILCDENVLIARQGKRIAIAGRNSPPPKAKPRSAEKMYTILLDLVREGMHRRGNPFPKQAYFARLHHVSVSTVKAAFDRLIAEGFVRKEGKRFYIRSPSNCIINSYDTPVIIILGRKSTTWNGICNSRFAQSFGTTFVDLANEAGIELHCCLSHPSKNSPFLPAGRSATCQFIESLGDRYYGTLICDSPSYIGSLDNWIQHLSKYRRPIVWFDRAGDTNVPLAHSGPLFYRCRFDENRVTEIALDALGGFNHTVAAYPWHVDDPLEQWQEKRLNEMQKFNSKTPRYPRIVGVPPILHEQQSPTLFLQGCRTLESTGIPIIKHAFDFFESESSYIFSNLKQAPEWLPKRYQAVTAAILSKMRPPDEKKVKPYYTQSRIILNAARLVPCLNIPDVTAILAPNDRLASMFFRWLKDVGVAIPQEISLLSFDNTYRYSFSPLATIDYRFGLLGHQAFHAIINDVPLPRDIPIQPRIIAGHTLGPAPQKSPMA